MMPSWTGRTTPRSIHVTTPPRLISARWPRPSGACRACRRALTRSRSRRPGRARPRSPPAPCRCPPRAGSPVGRVYDLDGQVLLLGVGHDADTTLHLAELLAGVPYRLRKHVTVVAGRTARAGRIRGERPLLRALRLADHGCAPGACRGKAPSATPARLARSRDIVAVTLEHLARDPLSSFTPRRRGVPSVRRRARASAACRRPATAWRQPGLRRRHHRAPSSPLSFAQRKNSTPIARNIQRFPGTHIRSPPKTLIVERREPPGPRRRRRTTGYSTPSASVISAATSCIGIPTRKRYSIPSPGESRGSSGTGLITGHHMSVAVAMNIRWVAMCTSWFRIIRS